MSWKNQQRWSALACILGLILTVIVLGVTAGDDVSDAGLLAFAPFAAASFGGFIWFVVARIMDTEGA